MKMLLAFLAGSAALSIARWRLGVFIMVFIGFFQDVVRKLDPQQDVIYTAMVTIYVALVIIGVYLSGDHRKGERILSIFPFFRIPVTLFVSLIVIQAFRGYLEVNSLVIFGIGIIVYLSPIVAVLLGYRYVITSLDCLRFLRFYVVVACIFLVGIYMEAMGMKHDLLGSVGSGIYIYTYKAVRLVTGFFRASETAAWHGATAAMLAMILVTIERRLFGRVLWVGMSLLATGAVFLTGRRKGLVEIAIFILFALMLVIIGKRRFAKAYVGAIIGLCVVALSIIVYLPFGDYFRDLDAITYRLTSYARSPIERVWSMTIGSFDNVVSYNSVFGAGAGLGSQGAQYFGGMRTGGSAESGFGKILAEIGVLGLVVFFWLIYRIGRYGRDILVVLKDRPVYEQLSVGIAAIMLANIVNFLAAHQAYGDPFVILMLGLLVGMFFALPVLAYKGLNLVGSGLQGERAHGDRLMKGPQEMVREL